MRDHARDKQRRTVLFQTRKASAVCTTCGLPNDRALRTRCSVCAGKQAARDAVRYARQGVR